MSQSKLYEIDQNIQRPKKLYEWKAQRLTVKNVIKHLTTRLQPRVTSPGATVDDLLLLVCLFVYVFVCLFVFVTLFAFVFVAVFFSRILGMGGWGRSINQKDTGVSRESRASKSLLARVIGMSFGLVGRWGDSKLQLAGVGKLNGWVLELTFAGQIINFKFLLVYLFFY